MQLEWQKFFATNRWCDGERNHNVIMIPGASESWSGPLPEMDKSDSPEIGCVTAKHPMSNELPALGDMIESREEAGIVCHLSPPIMRTFPFTSYVIYSPNSCRIIRRNAVTEVAPVKTELVDRIRKYYCMSSCDAPTGGA